jgi:hypothetical protein
MIAGSYTPFTVCTLSSSSAVCLAGPMWLAALAGVILNLIRPRWSAAGRYRRGYANAACAFECETSHRRKRSDQLFQSDEPAKEKSPEARSDSGQNGSRQKEGPVRRDGASEMEECHRERRSGATARESTARSRRLRTLPVSSRPGHSPRSPHGAMPCPSPVTENPTVRRR